MLYACCSPKSEGFLAIARKQVVGWSQLCHQPEPEPKIFEMSQCDRRFRRPFERRCLSIQQSGKHLPSLSSRYLLSTKTFRRSSSPLACQTAVDTEMPTSESALPRWRVWPSHTRAQIALSCKFRADALHIRCRVFMRCDVESTVRANLSVAHSLQSCIVYVLNATPKPKIPKKQLEERRNASPAEAVVPTVAPRIFFGIPAQ